ncbi:putative transmembrane protein [Toxoplasma gondii p89]|uniref:Putative transmembrane protein n=1 Tax=Toxoplasma gondii p89 TaxID=943119 RepID=A0A086JA96_TOXGO|nr:putative transmembrane protein [Toxoplasma gondii p89]
MMCALYGLTLRFVGDFNTSMSDALYFFIVSVFISFFSIFRSPVIWVETQVLREYLGRTSASVDTADAERAKKG